MREDFFFADDLRELDRREVVRLDDDFFALFRLRAPPLPLVSPASRRCLFTVAAAMRLAVAVLRPRFFADDLIFSYCRVRFALLTPRGGTVHPPIRNHLPIAGGKNSNTVPMALR